MSRLPQQIALAAVWCVAAFPQAATNPAYAPVEDDPALPRVLLLGDSISIGYTLPVRALLRGVANVHRPPANCGSTKAGVERLDRWLGPDRWDAIHFNFGLHDCFVQDGRHPVPPEQYEKNLRAIVGRLRRTGAKLIWASTTPIAGEELLRPRDRKPVHDFYARDIEAYNAIAARVMKAEAIPVNDLYAFVLPQVRELQKPGDLHFTSDGSERLAGRVAASIREELGLARGGAFRNNTRQNH